MVLRRLYGLALAAGGDGDGESAFCMVRVADERRRGRR